MSTPRAIHVHLTPCQIPPNALNGALVVVADVLRTTTTMLHALAAGTASILPFACPDAARSMKTDHDNRMLLAGEKDGKPLVGFDLGNSPGDFNSKTCKGATIVMATTNGTKAIHASMDARRVLLGAFVNFSAVCEQIDGETGAVHIVCSGTCGRPCHEDTLFAGALVDHLSEADNVALDDSARLAWDCFENNGQILAGALEICESGERLRNLGFAADIKAAAQIDRLTVAAEVFRDPIRVELCAATIKRQHWPHAANRLS